MSKYVKDLMVKDISSRWDGVEEMLVIDMVGMEAEDSVVLRKRFREKDMHLMVVKNSLARRATEGTALAPAFAGEGGSLTAAWGGEDIVTLAKEIASAIKEDKSGTLKAVSGALGGEKLSAENVREVSKWPSRAEMLSTISRQIMGPAMTLSAQLLGPGKLLASQVKQKGEEE